MEEERVGRYEEMQYLPQPQSQSGDSENSPADNDLVQWMIQMGLFESLSLHHR
jgi:hypothetical protein